MSGRIEVSRTGAVNRARSAIGHGCLYRLGQGGMKPHRAVPWDDEHECDCSGFVCWCLGLSRFQDPLWYDTTRIAAEAAAGSSIFTAPAWKDAQPGDLLVYPDRLGTDGRTRHGHVGIVTEIGVPGTPPGPVLVAHCSAGNWRRESDAIQESPPGLWIGAATVVARYTGFVGG